MRVPGRSDGERGQSGDWRAGNRAGMIAGDVGVSNRMGEAERLGFQLQSEEAEREMEGKRLHSEGFHAEFLRFLGEIVRIVLARQQER